MIKKDFSKLIPTNDVKVNPSLPIRITTMTNITSHVA